MYFILINKCVCLLVRNYNELIHTSLFFFDIHSSPCDSGFLWELNIKLTSYWHVIYCIYICILLTIMYTWHSWQWIVLLTCNLMLRELMFIKMHVLFYVLCWKNIIGSALQFSIATFILTGVKHRQPLPQDNGMNVWSTPSSRTRTQ